MRSPARRVASNSSSCATGKAEPNTIAAVVPAAILARVKSRAIVRANTGSASRDSAGKMQLFSHSSNWPPPYALSS